MSDKPEHDFEHELVMVEIPPVKKPTSLDWQIINSKADEVLQRIQQRRNRQKKPSA